MNTEEMKNKIITNENELADVSGGNFEDGRYYFAEGHESMPQSSKAYCEKHKGRAITKYEVQGHKGEKIILQSKDYDDICYVGTVIGSWEHPDLNMGFYQTTNRCCIIQGSNGLSYLFCSNAYDHFLFK